MDSQKALKKKTKDYTQSSRTATCPPKGRLPTTKFKHRSTSKHRSTLPVLMGTHWHRHHESQAWLRFESIALRHLQAGAGPLQVVSATTKSALRDFGLANAMAVARRGAQRGREAACFLVGYIKMHSRRSSFLYHRSQVVCVLVADSFLLPFISFFLSFFLYDALLGGFYDLLIFIFFFIFLHFGRMRSGKRQGYFTMLHLLVWHTRFMPCQLSCDEI